MSTKKVVGKAGKTTLTIQCSRKNNFKSKVTLQLKANNAI